MKLEDKNKEFEDKNKNSIKVYQIEVEQLKKKEQAYKTYKEWVLNQQWAMEREVKKYIQGFIKKLLENVVLDERGSNKIVDLVKSFEATVVDTISNKLQ